MNSPQDLREAVARALKANRFTRTGRDSLIANMDPPTANEMDDARVAVETVLRLFSSTKGGWVLAPVEATEAMVDAARGLCMFFNGMGGKRWTLGQHADSGGYGEGYAHLLTPQERAMSHFPKAYQAGLIYRAMIAASPSPPSDTKEG